MVLRGHVMVLPLVEARYLRVARPAVERRLLGRHAVRPHASVQVRLKGGLVAVCLHHFVTRQAAHVAAAVEPFEHEPKDLVQRRPAREIFGRTAFGHRVVSARHKTFELLRFRLCSVKPRFSETNINV